MHSHPAASAAPLPCCALLQSIAEADSGAPVTDAVLSVPTYYTEPERHAMLAATQVRWLGVASSGGCQRWWL